jgi:hypothetical protein
LFERTESHRNNPSIPSESSSAVWLVSEAAIKYESQWLRPLDTAPPRPPARVQYRPSGPALSSSGRNSSGEYFTNDGTHPPGVDLSFDIVGRLPPRPSGSSTTNGPQPLGEVATRSRYPRCGWILGQLVASGTECADDNMYPLLPALLGKPRHRRRHALLRARQHATGCVA